MWFQIKPGSPFPAALKRLSAADIVWWGGIKGQEHTETYWGARMRRMHSKRSWQFWAWN